MAVTTYTVKRGDNLTKIARAYSASIAGNTPVSYTHLTLPTKIAV